VPFGWLLGFLYDFTNSYGLALILFAVLVKLILLPTSAMSKKNSMKMSRIQPRLQAIQQKYAGDQVKMNEEMRALYKSEGVSMGGGCLWSFIPLLILIPLYAVVRQPLQYMLGQSPENAQAIIDAIKATDVGAGLFAGNKAYYEMIAAANLPAFWDTVKAAVPSLADSVKDGVNFEFLGGINLAANPVWKVWTDAWAWDWSHIGAFLLPVASCASQFVSMIVSQKMNNSVITNEKGVQDKETAKNSQANQSMKMMMWTMPLMSLIIGFTFPAAMSLYWLAQGVISTLIDVILTKHYRKKYDAEDAERLKKAMELEAAEAEKERIRAEKRAANPEGITANTSKKKLQQKQKQEQEAAKAAAAKEYAAKKGEVIEEKPKKEALSGISSRPYCKGRAYDPNRYASQSTEE
jgi:YidC/Oxa1 family membrane protein insertase